MRREKTSIRKKLIGVLVILVLLQSVLYFAVLFANGGLSYLGKYASNAFSNTVLTRKNTLETMMNTNWSSIEETADTMCREIQTRLHIKGKKVSDLYDDSELNDYVLSYLCNDAATLLSDNGTVEVYVMLQGYGSDTSEGRHCGFLFRDLDPDTYGQKKDILMEVGQNSIARKMKISLDSYWRSRFDFEDITGNHDFFTAPVGMVEEKGYTNIQELGYWSEPYSWYPGDIEVISYSVPLVVSGEVVGIMGVTLSEQYIADKLNPQELDSSGTASYTLGILDRQTMEYTSYLASGPVAATLNDHGQTLVLEEEPYNGAVYPIRGSSFYAAVHYIELYKRTSPYNDRQWVLLAVEPEEMLFKMSHDVYRTILTATLISLVLAIGVSILTGSSVASPIVNMAKEIQNFDSSKRIRFRESGVREIDALGNAISVLNESVRQNASKLSQIIEMVDLPIGVIEYQPDSGSVFCTYKIVELMGLSENCYKDGLLNREVFNRFFQDNHIEYLLTEDGEQDCYIFSDAEDRWLHIKSLLQDGKVMLSVSDISREVQEKLKIEYERDYDVLTNLLNRRAFKRKVLEILTNQEKYALRTGAMIMWDLDNLKYVNDSYGHDYGDEYIKNAAQVFATLTKKGGVVGRISGDEFMAFVPNIHTKSELLHMVQNIKTNLNDTKVEMPDGNQIAVRASGGIAWYPDDGTEYEDLKRYADFAMYDTKSTYKGEFKEFNKTAYEKDSFIMSAREEFNSFIDKKLLRYEYQPIVNAYTGEVFAYEALMRPMTENMVTPSDVMRMATAQSRLPDIERLTFTLGIDGYCRQEAAQTGRRLFINSIPNQTLSKKFMEEYIDSTGFDFHKVVVEIIESEQSDMKVMEMKEKQIRKLGGKIAVDDFGAGYSSESVLLHMNPDYVKIDMEIVQGISEDENRQTIVLNLVNYCHPRGIKVIAEGIENQEDMCAIMECQVDYLQGFYIASPTSVAGELNSKTVKEIRSLASQVQKKNLQVDM